MDDKTVAQIKKLQQIIQDLKDQLEQEQAVKKSEVSMNYDLKCYNKKLEIQIKEISRINESFLDQLVKLRLQLGSIFDQS
tara:strand:+ start:624 stop:863 length:240 start_codon:yes stop_codon:yes gene_type:complete